MRECACVKGKGVHRFVLDPSYGEFIYVGPMTIPAGGGKQIYSVNEGNYNVWDDNIKDAIDEFKVRAKTLSGLLVCNCRLMSTLLPWLAGEGRC